MAYSPEEAQAAVAGLVANPIPATSRQTIISGGAFNSWDIRWIPGMPGRHYGDVRIEDQEAEPTNPGIREVTASTYGQTIPVSLGRRRLPGNIVQSTQMVPRLVGGRDYEITYQIPIYEDPPDDEPFSVDVDPAPDRERPDPENPPNKCGQDPCRPDPSNPPPCDNDVTYSGKFFGFTDEDLGVDYIPPGCVDAERFVASANLDNPGDACDVQLPGTEISIWMYQGSATWAFIETITC
jgi:hypothetical protein